MGTVSVIIPTYGRNKSLRRCLLGIQKQSRYPDEIIVVDNSNNKSARATVLEFGKLFDIKLIYLHERKRGVVHARNKALRHSSSRLLAFLDDDCSPDVDWLCEMEKSFESNKVFAVVGKSLNGTSRNIFSFIQFYISELNLASYRYKEKNKTYSYLIDTKNVMMRTIKKISNPPFFSPLFARYGRYEDIDFSMQLLIKNRRVLYNSKAVTTHYSTEAALGFVKRLIHSGRALFMFKEKWVRIDNGKLHQALLYASHHNSSSTNKKLLSDLLNRSKLFQYVFNFLFAITPIITRFGYRYEQCVIKLKKLDYFH